MHEFTAKKSIPVVLGAALALNVVSGFVTAPIDGGTVIASVACAAPAKAWDFSQNIGSWTYFGNYSYSGQASAAYDPAFGGSLKLAVDFSKDGDATWSEVKLSDTSITKAAPLVLSDAKVIEFDLYYDKTKISGDSLFKVKVYGQDEKGTEIINDMADDIGMSRAKPVDGSNLVRVHVKVPFMDAASGKLSHLELSVVSYLSKYKGDVYINNIKL